MRIALYQPEIAGNTGAVLRIAACFGVAVDIIEPCGFVWSDARMRRAGMDYAERVEVVRHAGWDAFRNAATGRLMLMTARGETSLLEVGFAESDILVMGSESAGVPDAIAAECGARVRIPIQDDARSLNLAVATGIAVFEAVRQCGLGSGGRSENHP